MKDHAGIHLHRFGYSSCPWRLAHQVQRRCLEIKAPGLWWRRKREGQRALAVIQGLAALPWELDQQIWTATQQGQLRGALLALPEVQAEQQVMVRLHAQQVAIFHQAILDYEQKCAAEAQRDEEGEGA